LLRSEVTGRVGKDGRVLLIKSIHVKYFLKTDKDNIDTAERVHGMHADFCPVARSIKDSIAISTELVIVS
jgi:uncharacterized OsmC-like protein